MDNKRELEVGVDEPLYNIGVVSRMTGISMATLRAWERRYNFPESERTAGGHRLYSERDVLRLRWVKARIDEGMQTAQSINALRHQEETGHLVLTAESLSPERTEKIARPVILPKGGDLNGETKPYLQVFEERLIDVLTRRETQKADVVLGEVMGIASTEDLILRVVGPAMSKMGEYWLEGSINVATEHLATNYLRHRLLTWMLTGPPLRQVKPIVMACAPDEWHEGSLLVLGALLRRRGWPISYLGQAVPMSDLASFIRELQPKLVILVAMTDSSANSLSEWPKWLPEVARNNKPVIGYGGRVFTEQPEWRLKIQGMYLGNTFEEGVATVEQVLA